MIQVRKQNVQQIGQFIVIFLPSFSLCLFRIFLPGHNLLIEH